MPEILSLRQLRVAFPRAEGAAVNVVRGADLETNPGQTLGLVGESGSGKSMTALAIMGLTPFSAQVSGSVRYHGRELVGLREPEYEKIRGAGISIVFQDPSTSLNPVLTIEQQLLETIQTHREISQKEARNLAIESLRSMDIPSPEKRINDYAHQLSGGMKQRILISMALACEPDCLILDEPTTALDVTVQAQILDLVERIQSFNQVSVILISHDLGIVSEISDKVAVMYAGRIVEQGPTADILNVSRHPYTRGLLSSIPELGAPKKTLATIPGFPPNPAELPSGCPFHPRCSRVQAICRQQDPDIRHEQDQAFACWNPEPQHG